MFRRQLFTFLCMAVGFLDGDLQSVLREKPVPPPPPPVNAMATTMYLRGSRRVPSVRSVTGGEVNYWNMQRTAGSASFDIPSVLTTDANGERPLRDSLVTDPEPLRGTIFASERVATEVTIAGQITVSVWALRETGFQGRIRARLSKITAGGSNVETPLGSVDTASDLTTTATEYVLLFTPATSVTVAPNERFFLRLSAIPVSGSFGTDGTKAIVKFSASAGATGDSLVQFTETVAFKDNGTKLYPLRTNTIGIGNFFDLSETRGASAATTGVVNTVASGGEIQWTRTAGGTVLEWISARVKDGWSVKDLGSFAQNSWAHESNGTANAGRRFKFFRRAPDGTETLVATMTTTIELTTSSSIQGSDDGSITPTDFRENDRLVIRAYIHPIGTMGGARTATITYDHNAADVSGDTYFTLYEDMTWKLESDPEAMMMVPSGGSMLGASNGQ